MKNKSWEEFSNLKEEQIETTALRTAIKRGVYKELYKKQMLTEQQLNELLSLVKQ